MRKITHAIICQLLANAPIFFSLEKGAKKKTLDVTYQPQNTNRTYRFEGREALGVLDLRVLQQVIAMATAKKNEYGGVKDLLRYGKRYREAVELDNTESQTVIGLNFGITKLGRLLSGTRPSGPTLERLRGALDRLAAVSVTKTENAEIQKYKLIACCDDGDIGGLAVVFPPEISIAVLKTVSYIRLDMREVRLLDSDVARLLHARLHWINSGQVKKIRVSTMCSYVYGSGSASASITARRRKSVLLALDKLATALGWGVKALAGENYEISRPISKRTFAK